VAGQGLGGIDRDHCLPTTEVFALLLGWWRPR
jgi:hypothetical protein